MSKRRNPEPRPLDSPRRPAARELIDLAPDDRALLILPPISRVSGAFTAAWAVLLADRVFEHVRLIAPGTGSEVDRVARLLDSAGRRAMLHLTGERVPLDDLLLACDAALFLPPGGAPIDALISAMAAGRPIVATAVPCVTRLLTDGVNAWLCRPNDPKDATRRLVEVLDGGPRVSERCDAVRRQAQSVAQSHIAETV
jgi:glycosyltransferase involved in cell wall biosynthesis